MASAEPVETNEPAFAVRPSRLDDVEALAALEEQGYLEHRDPGAEESSRRTPSTTPWTATDLGRELASAVGRGWLAESGGVLLGHALFRAFGTDSLDDGEAELLRITVLPSARRRGIAARLLSTAFSALGDEGVGRHHLEVRADNRPALALYEGFGFVVTGRRAAYYPDGTDALSLTRAP